MFLGKATANMVSAQFGDTAWLSDRNCCDGSESKLVRPGPHARES
jgi:hypothetical protein